MLVFFVLKWFPIFPSPVAKLVFDLVPELDVPGEVFVSDENSADRAGLLWHEGVLGTQSPTHPLGLTDGALGTGGAVAVGHGDSRCRCCRCCRNGSRYLRLLLSEWG